MARKPAMDDPAILLQRMEGLTVALSTPLNDDGTLDVAGMERLIELVLDGGVTCLFALGWAGEGPLLSDETRAAVMRETCRIARGRVPVMIGVSEQSLERSLPLANAARQAGADLVLSTPPYSYDVPEHLLADYFRDLAARSGMPLVVYQNDELGKRLSFDTLQQLRQTPGIVGTKTYVPYLELQRYFYKLHEPNRFAVMSGDECQYAAALQLGVRHFTMGGPGNFCPAFCTSIYLRASEGQWDAVRDMQRRLAEFCDAVYAPAQSAYAAIKAVLHCMGICSRHISSPHFPVSDDEQERIRAVLQNYGDILNGKSDREFQGGWKHDLGMHKRPKAACRLTSRG